MEIWINPACSKCRTAKAALDEAGIAYTERRYLDEVPTAAELDAVLLRLNLDPWQIARPAESKAAGIDLPRDAEHRDAWIAALLVNPKAIQRPIITTDDGAAVIARDDETLATVVKEAGR
ncbi:MAG TPA: ArsC/Spx/MgsR family protein [Marmoricola sp.]|nr:ArsC/Spx/MgsR family protein [Marmoricola sp.]